MKKFLVKITVYIILSLLLISLNATLPIIATADDDVTRSPSSTTDVETRSSNPQSGVTNPSQATNPAKNDTAGKVQAFEDMKKTENLCIQEDVRKQYLITVIEAPLSDEELELKNEEGKTKFKTMICWRNTLVTPTASETELLNKCLDSAKEHANDPKNDSSFYCQRVQVLLSTGGTSLLEGYIATIYRWAASIVGIIAVLVIIVSGIQISLAGGDTQALDSAKGRIIKSLAGIAVLFLSGVILYTINPNFFSR